MNELENFSVGIEPADGWRPHPYGSWDARVNSVKYVELAGKPAIKILLETSQGSGEHTIWLPTREMIQKADLKNKAHPETIKLAARMSQVKMVLGKLGVATDAALQNYPWSQVMGMFGTAIVGAKCRYKVSLNEANAKYRNTDISTFTSEPDHPDHSVVEPLMITPNGAAGNFSSAQHNSPTTAFDSSPAFDAAMPAY